MGDVKNAREFWIEFEGKGASAFVYCEKVDGLNPDAIHVREVLPQSPDRRAQAEKAADDYTPVRDFMTDSHKASNAASQVAFIAGWEAADSNPVDSGEVGDPMAMAASLCLKRLASDDETIRQEKERLARESYKLKTDEEIRAFFFGFEAMQTTVPAIWYWKERAEKFEAELAAERAKVEKLHEVLIAIGKCGKCDVCPQLAKKYYAESKES